jgi:hypothetical protein
MKKLDKNPNGGKFVLPKGYTDLGWQLYPDNPDLTKCKELGHKRHQFDNSTYLYRFTDVIYICDECKNVHHVDMSD